MKGRYVIIIIPGDKKILTLCEVEVYVEYVGKCGQRIDQIRNFFNVLLI